MDKELAKVKVRFSSYYKYSFTFKNDEGYAVSVGGISDEMYKASITADKDYTIQEVSDECGGSLRVTLNGEELYYNAW